MSERPEVTSGDIHNQLLGAASDSKHGFRVIPRLMVALLRNGGWQRMVRPADGREFFNSTVEEWVLGEPWAGLYFPSWDALYAMLDRSTDCGEECKRLLIELGAPVNGVAVGARKRMTFKEAGALGGRGNKAVDNIKCFTGGGTSTEYLAGRLKRDNPELAEQVIAGRISAHAAAVQAGIRKPTWTAPDDPELLAKKIGQRYPGWKMVKEE